MAVSWHHSTSTTRRTRIPSSKSGRDARLSFFTLRFYRQADAAADAIIVPDDLCSNEQWPGMQSN